MATLISKATGNFTAAGTWAPIATASLAELDSEAGNTGSATGGGSSAAFTPAAEEIDGVAVKIRNTSGSGTITVKLANQTSPGSREGTLTINTADLLSNVGASTVCVGWYLFKFTPVTPNGTDSYKITVTSSINGTTNLFTNGTANNWCRMLRRTATPSAPATDDKLIMIGEMTGAGTSNSFTVTMDNTATTSFGPTVSGGPPQGMVVGDKCTLTFGTAASTNYYLKVKGILMVMPGGTLSIGTSGTPIPSTSTAVLEFASVANVDSGLFLHFGTTFNSYGATKTSISTLLTVDKAAAATTLTIGDTTGWAVSDELGIASTSTTPGECEKMVIQTVDSGTTVTLTAGLGFAHSGTSPTQAEVINLTRNVKIRGISATLQGYIFVNTSATVTCRYTEFSWLGSGTGNKKGIDVTTITGSFDMQFCSLHDFIVAASVGLTCSGAAHNNWTYSNNVSYNMINSHVSIAATTGTNWTISNCVAMLSAAGTTGAAFNILDVGGTFTNNTVAGTSIGTIGMVINESGTVGTISGLVAHSCGTNGFSISNIGANNVLENTIGSLTSWRNGSVGVALSAVKNTTFTSITAFGNASTSNITLSGGGGKLLFSSLVLNGDTTFATINGFALFSGVAFADIEIENSDLGSAAGIKTAHSSGDIVFGANGAFVRITLRNCKLASTTEIVNQGFMASGSSIRSAKHDQTAGLHRSWFPYGQIDIDTTTYKTASPAEKLTPNNATKKLESGPKRAAVANGGTITPTVYVNKSAAYNGNQPRLVVKKNVAAGITADTVLATASGGTGSWLTLTGTTAAVTDDAVLEFVVDCDGTAGTATIDDWSVA